MRTLRRPIIAFLVAGAAVVGPGCGGDFGLKVNVPSSEKEAAVWIEVGAYKDGDCDALKNMLSNGVPEGAAARLAFKIADKARPKLGDLPYGKYAFAATARDEECGVVASGCTSGDLGGSDVSINLTASDEPTGKCPIGASCQAAQCVPANDNADPSVGAGCSLELIGAGPLAKPAGGGASISAPTIAATPTGFIIGYREVDAGGSAGRIIILPIDLGGGALKEQRSPLPSACVGPDGPDGVGLVVNGENAMMALAKPACGGKPELQLLNFNTAPGPEKGVAVGKFYVSSSPGGGAVSLSPARAAARGPFGSYVVFTENGAGGISFMDPAAGVGRPSGSFGGATGIRGAWIAATETVLALLAVGGGSVTAGDAGLDQPSGSTLRLLMLPANTPVDSLNAATNEPRAPITFEGDWGSIAAVGGRVIVMSDGTGPGRSVSYRAFDMNNDTPADTGGFSLEAQGKVTSGDVTILGDRAYFAALEPAAVALHVFAGATTKLTPLRSVSFERESRISAISTVRDGRVAVAATEGRVGVAWTTAKELTKNDPTGGYAVFGCTK